MSAVFGFLFVYEIQSDAVQHNKPIVTVLDLLTKNDECRGIELWNFDPPVLSGSADFTADADRGNETSRRYAYDGYPVDGSAHEYNH